MFVSDYRPTKRIGIEELDGAILMLRDAIDDKHANGEADAPWYEGAWLALRAVRFGNYEYPRDFMAVLVNDIAEFSR